MHVRMHRGKRIERLPGSRPHTGTAHCRSFAIHETGNSIQNEPRECSRNWELKYDVRRNWTRRGPVPSCFASQFASSTLDRTASREEPRWRCVRTVCGETPGSLAVSFRVFPAATRRTTCSSRAVSFRYHSSTPRRGGAPRSCYACTGIVSIQMEIPCRWPSTGTEVPPTSPRCSRSA